MKIRILILFLITILTSCSSPRVIKFDESYSNLTNLIYTEPIYEFASQEEKTSKSGQYFMKYTNQTLDSIFTVDSLKYKIHKKIAIKDKDKLTATLIPKLNKIIEQIQSQNSVEQIKIPKEFYSLNESQFLMFTLIKPNLISSDKRYPNSIVLRPSTNSFFVQFSEVYIFILDFKKDKIAFYGNSSGKLNNLGYRKKIIKDINSIYDLMKE
ncbi:hypothetical protein BN863_18110 [Formosa agariphila KMM 3901]|uniref:Lipoprotein n=1 Tax=Formosa agariphila (strain DSM 15362 / KCTC 12365 / LMG 23005 / KMM 3901 / M-2Alg 35-1) TaxID=1347342 RepID=T2KM34_FORAG|nr:hypothetical protein [Formosa agariphila]CDF79523.1 hypothetical protein BN863_18110 [Formosa agariphila KMM 3901]